jgi:L-erythro-3,5-diaminohexanoate dehydrogenase
MQNPVTGSGGMFIGKVEAIGHALAGEGLHVGDSIASLVSLSLTPLKINKINCIRPEIDRVEIDGQAILFESGIYAKLPDDMDEGLALAALDVAGAPAQTAKLVKSGQSVLILGAGGKSGMLVAYEAMKRVGPTGRVVGNVYLSADADVLKSLNLCHEVVVEDATQPIALLYKALAANCGDEYDVVINCVNVPNTEMSTILPCRQEGTVYFFSMATHFGKAALGAEGVGKDITMIVGNGYTKDHAEITLWELRENKGLRKLFEERYV